TPPCRSLRHAEASSDERKVVHVCPTAPLRLVPGFILSAGESLAGGLPRAGGSSSRRRRKRHAAEGAARVCWVDAALAVRADDVESHEKLLRAGAVESSCLAGSSPSARRPSGVAPPPQQVVPVLVVASRAIRRTGGRFLAHARRVPEKTDGFPGIWWEEVVTPVSAAWRCRSLPCR